MDETNLILGMIFSSFGMGFFIYGKKQRRAVPLWVGLALMLMPIAITNPWLECGAGSLLIALPYFVRA